MIDEKKLSNEYFVRRLTREDVTIIYELSAKNTIFYEHHPPFVTNASIIEDMKALPPGKNYDDKYYVGFFDHTELIAIMDLILDYPEAHTAFIGLFMVNASAQGKGIGSNIISESLACLKEYKFTKIRLGVDKGNPQSFHFWCKNKFSTDESADGAYIVMERTI